ncbi:hypothetical protein C8P68_102489 [Mucilaginibacter yixingensis]|uniref:tRNA (5-methylaminomethyl-2-thiouridylate)-methyltransferase n=1 Tax=Mucilaginibacter yixingensis TaxID=1295612 RepID=A0A2T5JD15_9SPHI|nr:hypothetical protein [Mucilaginibacter yixingensis]PTQ99661.1 hypothetical protein C8P68_102489 [Mucilaginibacter yixingensis]
MDTNIRQLQTLLKFTYGLVPVVAGADKFLNLLTDWEKYLAPWLKALLPFNGHVFMMIVGVIEIVAGIIVLAKPQIGAWIVAAWLTVIALTLISGGNYFDVAVRDLVMAIGAYTLAKLSVAVSKSVA